MRLRTIPFFFASAILLTAYIPSIAGAGSIWEALQDIETVTGIRFVPNTDLPARFTRLEPDSNLVMLRAYREEDELGEATARLFTWKHDPGVVDWYATIPDFEEDVWKTYHADGTVELEPLSEEFKKAHQDLLKLMRRQ